MADVDEVARLKATISVYERHHAQCCAISAESRESVDRELLDLRATTLPEPPSLSQLQEEHSTLKRPITSGTNDATTKNALHLQHDGIQIISFNPTKPTRDSVNRSRVKRKRRTWEYPTKSFVANAPLAREWNDRVQQLGITISAFTSEPIEGLSKPIQGHAESTIVGRARYHTQQAMNIITVASCSLARARMYLLCVLTYFCVLDMLSLVEKGIICDMMTRMVDGSEMYKKRIWDGAGWMNGLMRSLVQKGWTWPQATTLCLFCAPHTPSAYATINNPNSLAHIVGVLQDPAYLPPSDAFCVNFTVPEVIAAWEPTVSLGSVRKVLGYDDANSERVQTRHTTEPEAAGSTENASELRQGGNVHIGLEVLDTTGSGRPETMEGIGLDTSALTTDAFSGSTSSSETITQHSTLQPAQKRRRFEPPTWRQVTTSRDEATTAESTPTTRDISDSQQCKRRDKRARGTIAEATSANLLSSAANSDQDVRLTQGNDGVGFNQPDQCDEGNVTEAVGVDMLALMNVAREPSPHLLSPTQVRGAIAGDQAVEPMTPPSAVMTEYWQKGDWDLFT